MGFWDLLGGPPTGRLRVSEKQLNVVAAFVCNIVLTHLLSFLQEKYEYKYFTPKQPILYKVGLGMGYLELPQGMFFWLFVECVFSIVARADI